MVRIGHPSLGIVGLLPYDNRLSPNLQYVESRTVAGIVRHPANLDCVQGGLDGRGTWSESRTARHGSRRASVVALCRPLRAREPSAGTSLRAVPSRSQNRLGWLARLGACVGARFQGTGIGSVSLVSVARVSLPRSQVQRFPPAGSPGERFLSGVLSPLAPDLSAT